MGVLGIRAGIAQRAPLAQQIPTAVELDLDCAQPVLVILETIRVVAVGLLAVAELMLLGDEPLDPLLKLLIVHEPTLPIPAAFTRARGRDAWVR